MKRFSASVPQHHPVVAHNVLCHQRSSKPPHDIQISSVPTQGKNGKIIHQHNEFDDQNNIHPCVDTVVMSLRSRMDVQCTDGYSMLLQYVSSYVTKMRDDFICDDLYNDLLAKTGAFLPTDAILSPLPPVIAKVRYSQYRNWKRHIYHSHLNLQVPEVSSKELLLSRSIRSELSRLRCHGHSLLLSSYFYRISRKENSDCSACGHSLQDLNHLLLDCPASEPLRKSIFGSSLSILDLWSRPWGVAQLLGLRGVPLRPHPSEGVG